MPILYTTVDVVRAESGFTNNPHITDDVIEEFINNAESEVDGSLALGGYDLPLTSVPGMVKNAAKLLSAGYLLLSEYGPEHTGTNKEGNSKLKQARDLLLRIENGKTTILDGDSQAVSHGSKVSGYPDSTAATNTPSEAPAFRIIDKF